MERNEKSNSCKWSKWQQEEEGKYTEGLVWIRDGVCVNVWVGVWGVSVRILTTWAIVKWRYAGDLHRETPHTGSGYSTLECVLSHHFKLHLLFDYVTLWRITVNTWQRKTGEQTSISWKMSPDGKQRLGQYLWVCVTLKVQHTLEIRVVLWQALLLFLFHMLNPQLTFAENKCSSFLSGIKWIWELSASKADWTNDVHPSIPFNGSLWP